MITYNNAYATYPQTAYTAYSPYDPRQTTGMPPQVVTYNNRTLINNIYNNGGIVNVNNASRPPYYPPYYTPQTRPNTAYYASAAPVGNAYSPPLSNLAMPTFNSARGTGNVKGDWGDKAYQYAYLFDKKAPPPWTRPVTPKPRPIAPPAPRKLVAANEHSSYWGDPHVADADRSDKGNKRQDNFVVKGDGVFNLLTDRNISLNAQHKKYDQWGIEVTDQIGLRIPFANITFSAYGTPQLNGGVLESGKTIMLPDQTKISWDGTTLSVTSGDSGEYNVSISIVTTEHKNADGSPVKYLDTDLSTKGNGVGNDGIMPSGILGEGFDDDNEARTALKKDLSTYKRNGLLG